VSKIIVTGASGQFGHAATSQLLEAGAEVIALTRSPGRLADLAARGAEVRAADFDDPSSLPAAMAGGDKMLLISTTMVGERPRQHGNAIDAAVAAGVRHIVYTSVTDGGNPDHPAIEQHDHYKTEQMLKTSGGLFCATVSIPKRSPLRWPSRRWRQAPSPTTAATARSPSSAATTASPPPLAC
jgi:NAD(P)H dehydrogenase (quinone)